MSSPRTSTFIPGPRVRGPLSFVSSSLLRRRKKPGAVSGDRFEESKHPRGPGGKFRRTFAAFKDAVARRWFNGRVKVHRENYNYTVEPSLKTRRMDSAWIRKQERELFGHVLKPSEWAGLTGAPDGARISVVGWAQPDTGGVQLEATIEHSEFYGERSVRGIERAYEGGDVELRNQVLILERGYAPRGLGARMLARQVVQAEKLGIKKIFTVASRAEDDPVYGRMNGYYTWPRYGYDNELRTGLRARFKEETGLTATRVSDLMKTVEGRDWWRENGESISLYFNTSRGSQARRILGGYLYAMGAGIGEDLRGTRPSRRFAEARELPPGDQVEDLSELEERVMDDVWADVYGDEYERDRPATASEPLDFAVRGLYRGPRGVGHVPFNPAKHPRGPGGRFRTVAGIAKAFLTPQAMRKIQHFKRRQFRYDTHPHYTAYVKAILFHKYRDKKKVEKHYNILVEAVDTLVRGGSKHGDLFHATLKMSGRTEASQFKHKTLDYDRSLGDSDFDELVDNLKHHKRYVEEYLRAKHGDSFTMFRGVVLPSRPNRKTGEEFEAETNVLSSWTRYRGVAEVFARNLYYTAGNELPPSRGYVLEARFKPEDILHATEITGDETALDIGLPYFERVTLSKGPTRVRVRSRHNPWTGDGMPDGDMAMDVMWKYPEGYSESSTPNLDEDPRNALWFDYVRRLRKVEAKEFATPRVSSLTRKRLGSAAKKHDPVKHPRDRQGRFINTHSRKFDDLSQFGFKRVSREVRPYKNHTEITIFRRQSKPVLEIMHEHELKRYEDSFPPQARIYTPTTRTKVKKDDYSNWAINDPTHHHVHAAVNMGVNGGKKIRSDDDLSHLSLKRKPDAHPFADAEWENTERGWSVRYKSIANPEAPNEPWVLGQASRRKQDGSLDILGGQHLTHGSIFEFFHMNRDRPSSVNVHYLKDEIRDYFKTGAWEPLIEMRQSTGLEAPPLSRSPGFVIPRGEQVHVSRYPITASKLPRSIKTHFNQYEKMLLDVGPEGRKLLAPNPVDTSTTTGVYWKGHVMRQLAARLRGNDDFLEYSERRIPMRHDKQLYSEDVVEQTAARLIKAWQESSSDHHPLSLAMQLAAERTFGIAQSPVIRRSRAWSEAEELYTKHAPALTAFLRAMYENTQDDLRTHGISDVLLFRGLGLKRLPSGIEPSRVQVVNFNMNPMSSFSVNPMTAYQYADYSEGAAAFMFNTVPRERIISTTRTGYGSTSELEMVVLGRSGEFYIRPITKEDSDAFDPDEDEYDEGTLIDIDQVYKEALRWRR